MLSKRTGEENLRETNKADVTGMWRGETMLSQCLGHLILAFLSVVALYFAF